jgi:hypothetical protein
LVAHDRGLVTPDQPEVRRDPAEVARYLAKVRRDPCGGSAVPGEGHARPGESHRTPMRACSLPIEGSPLPSFGSPLAVRKRKHPAYDFWVEDGESRCGAGLSLQEGGEPKHAPPRAWCSVRFALRHRDAGHDSRGSVTTRHAGGTRSGRHAEVGQHPGGCPSRPHDPFRADGRCTPRLFWRVGNPWAPERSRGPGSVGASHRTPIRRRKRFNSC